MLPMGVGRPAPRRWARTAVATIALALFIEGADGKRVEGNLGLSSYVTEQYVSKFSFSSGRLGDITVRLARAREGLSASGGCRTARAHATGWKSNSNAPPGCCVAC